MQYKGNILTREGIENFNGSFCIYCWGKRLKKMGENNSTFFSTTETKNYIFFTFFVSVRFQKCTIVFFLAKLKSQKTKYIFLNVKGNEYWVLIVGNSLCFRYILVFFLIYCWEKKTQKCNFPLCLQMSHKSSIFLQKNVWPLRRKILFLQKIAKNVSSLFPWETQSMYFLPSNETSFF